MLIAGVLCLAAAVLVAAAGLRAVTRPAGGDPRSQAVRMLAPTQFAAAAMLAAGGVVALNSGLAGRSLRGGTGRGRTGRMRGQLHILHADLLVVVGVVLSLSCG